MESQSSKVMVILLLYYALSSAAYAADVLIVCSKDCSSNRATITSFVSYLKAQDPDIQFHKLSLSTLEIMPDMLPGGPPPSLIFALDFEAADRISKVFDKIPMVLGIAAQETDITELPNATGVVVVYGVKAQLEWMQHIAPSVHRVGVLYSTPTSFKMVERAQQTAPSLGLKIIAQEVIEMKDLPGALTNLLREVDILWGIPDAQIYTRQTARAVLLAAFRQRIPMVGMSSAWVKAGALYALGWNASDLGVQSGELAIKLLSGEQASQLPPQRPRQTTFSLNLKTVRHCNFPIPDQIIKTASHVFK